MTTKVFMMAPPERAAIDVPEFDRSAGELDVADEIWEPIREPEP